MILFSSFKMNLTIKFSSLETPIIYLTDSHSKLYTGRMRMQKTKQCNANAESLFGEYKMASISDRRAGTALGYWSGKSDDIEFTLLFNSFIVHCGRGSEVSYQNFSIL